MLMRINKIISAAAVLSMFFALPVLAETKAFADGSYVNLRSDASTEAEVKTQLQEKQNLQILGIREGFFHVDADGTEGYVSSDFVRFSSAVGIVNTEEADVKADGSSDIIGGLEKDSTVVLLGQSGDMLLIEFEGKRAFIHKSLVDCNYEDYLIAVSETPPPSVFANVISDTALNLRSEPTTSSEILAKIPSGDIIDVLEKGSEWTKVQTDLGKVGYVSNEFIVVKTGVKPEKPQVSAKGGEVVSYAKQFLGTRYVYGGTNLNKGVDCSGFVYSVYKHFGITLNRTSSSMTANGVKVAKSNLAAGDLVFFSNYGAKNIQHVGVYCGDGTFIHAASGRNMKVMVSELGETYYLTNYVTAARVIG